MASGAPDWSINPPQALTLGRIVLRIEFMKRYALRKLWSRAILFCLFFLFSGWITLGSLKIASAQVVALLVFMVSLSMNAAMSSVVDAIRGIWRGKRPAIELPA